MLTLRVLAMILPQLLLLLLMGASLDFLGGFNKTDRGLGILILLFIITPLTTLLLLVFELYGYYKNKRQLLSVKESRKQGNEQSVKSVQIARPGLAFILFLEALAINVYILLQARM